MVDPALTDDNTIIENKTNSTGDFYRRIYVYHRGTIGPFFPFLEYGKGFLNEGGFIEWITADKEKQGYQLHSLVEDDVVDFSMSKLTIDFVIKNLLKPNSYAYISIAFKRNFAGVIEHHLSYVPIYKNPYDGAVPF
jgi:hypothetical protein